jgi:hypothetical protein
MYVMNMKLFRGVAAAGVALVMIVNLAMCLYAVRKVSNKLNMLAEELNVQTPMLRRLRRSFLIFFVVGLLATVDLITSIATISNGSAIALHLHEHDHRVIGFAVFSGVLYAVIIYMSRRTLANALREMQEAPKRPKRDSVVLQRMVRSPSFLSPKAKPKRRVSRTASRLSLVHPLDQDPGDAKDLSISEKARHSRRENPPILLTKIFARAPSLLRSSSLGADGMRRTQATRGSLTGRGSQLVVDVEGTVLSRDSTLTGSGLAVVISSGSF